MSGEGEKTFAPTPKRLRDAALKGDVLRSRELAAAIGIAAGIAWLKFAGPWMLEALQTSARATFTWDRAALDDFAPGRIMMDLALTALPPLLVLAGGVMIAVLVAQLGLGGEGRWVGTNLALKGSRINPLSGLKRMFGATAMIELGKSIAKVLLLGAIAWYWAADNLPALFALGAAGALPEQLAAAWGLTLNALLALAAGMVVIAFIDVPIQLVRRSVRLKMTQQEMRDEHKEAEGSPERKAAIRQRQRQFASGAVAKAMREAQFVLTNPTHFAVAMVYDPTKAGAPIVLAKGRGEKALAMKELAAELKVPMLEYPALARSVYFTTRENQVIREELYAAVAAVLAFVFSLKRGETPVRPAIEIPIALRFDVDGRADAAATA